jgi:hypothetical protein
LRSPARPPRGSSQRLGSTAREAAAGTPVPRLPAVRPSRRGNYHLTRPHDTPENLDGANPAA